MNLILKIIFSFCLGLIVGHFCLGGSYYYTSEYSLSISFLGLLFSFVFIICNKNYSLIIPYSISLSIGTFFGVYYVAPEILISYLDVSVFDSYLLSLTIGFFNLYFIYILVLLKLLMIDSYNRFSNKFNRINFNYRILIVTVIVWFLNIITQHGFPSQAGYILIGNIDHLNLLNIIGISGYSFIIIYICVLLSFSIKEKRRKNYSAYLFIFLFLFLNYFINLNLDKNYDIQSNLEIGIVQYPFKGWSLENGFPDDEIDKEFKYILRREKELDLVLFPESSFPFEYSDFNSFSELKLIKSAYFYNKNLQLSFLKNKDNKRYNTSLLFRPNEEILFYYKEQLFPIGESAPFYSKIFLSEEEINPLSTKKNENKLFSVKNINYLPLLCFETYRADLFSKEDKIWSFVTVQSNESWIYEKRLRYYSNNFLRIRAKEFNTFILKSDAIGPSLIINPNGEIVKITRNERDFIEMSIPEKVTNKLEIYYLFREFSILFLIILNFLLIILFKDRETN